MYVFHFLSLFRPHPYTLLQQNMVKFSKEYEAELIPEWRDNYLNYRDMKRQIKKIKLSRVPKQPRQDMNGDYGLSIFEPICFVARKICGKFRNSDSKTDLIQVHNTYTNT